MIVAISGATGFVGRHLVRRCLAEGHQVRVLTRRGRSGAGLPDAVTVHRGDLAQDSDRLQGFVDGADVLYHCAGEIRDPARMRPVNVDGTRRLLAAAANRIGRWVQLSSVGVYGRCPSGSVTEETPAAPVGSYEESKAEADELVAAAGRQGVVAYTILRPSIVFGGDMPNRSLRQLATMIRRGVFFFVGAPGASANYIHVDNVVEALILCGRRSQAAGRVYNLSDWRPVEEFVGAFSRSMGRSSPRMRLAEGLARRLAGLARYVPGIPLTLSRIDALVNRCRYPTARIEGELGYRHRVSMEEGIAECVAAWRPAGR